MIFVLKITEESKFQHWTNWLVSRLLTSVVSFGDVGLQGLYMQIKEIFLGLFPGTLANWHGIVRFLLVNLLTSELCRGIFPQ